MLIDCHGDIEAEKMERDYLWAYGQDEKKAEARILTGLLFSDAERRNYAMVSLSRFLTDIATESWMSAE